MSKVLKRFFNIKSINEETKTVAAYVSNYNWDRMEERFAKGAWDLKNYLRNPVVLWLHNMDQAVPKVPIAKATKIQEDEFGLLSEAQFDEKNEFAMHVFDLFKRGFMSTFSVGFIPKKWMVEELSDGSGRKGYVWTDAELVEYSAVPVPANPGALIQRSDEELMVKAFGRDFIVEEEENGVKVLKFKQIVLGETEKFDPTEFQEKIELEQKVAPESQSKDDFKEALKSVLQLAKNKSGNRLDTDSLSLLKSTMSILNEIVMENVDETDKTELLALKGIVQDLGEFVKSNKPDYRELVSKILMQVEVSMRKGNR